MPLLGRRLMQSVYDGSQAIDRTPHPVAAFVQHVPVHPGGADALVTEQFLDCPDVVTAFKQMHGERMPECMAYGPLCDPGLRPLQCP